MIRFNNWRAAGSLAVLAALAACSRPTAPEPADVGRIVLAFLPGAPSAGAPAMRAGGQPFDSVSVRVFRRGPFAALEAVKGAAIMGPDSLVLSFTVIAENDKRVSVELFEGGTMTYFGYHPDVDVLPGKETSVTVDAFAFSVDSLSLAPGTVNEGESFALNWDGATGATGYRVQASASQNFSTIDFEQSVADTFVSVQRSPGRSYFRVAPETRFTLGAFTSAQFGYVIGGGGVLSATDFTAPRTYFSEPAVLPGEQVTINGENLDYPGTQVSIDGLACQIISTSWDRITVVMPLAADTDVATVTSPLLGGSVDDTVPVELVSLRAAYVTGLGSHTQGYLSRFSNHRDDFAGNGVLVVPVAELDTRDMNVFDIVVVAHDTGTDVLNWGGGQPARANAIANSRANVLAIGQGGQVYLRLTVPEADVTPGNTTQNTVHTTSPNSSVFRTPHPVTDGTPLPQSITFCPNPELMWSLPYVSPPAGVTLYASRAALDNNWILAEFAVTNPSGTPLMYMEWGYAGHPDELTTQGSDCLGNVMYRLHQNRAPVP